SLQNEDLNSEPIIFTTSNSVTCTNNNSQPLQRLCPLTHHLSRILNDDIDGYMGDFNLIDIP
ncbi:16448_t:CDS:1, partial [Entrophospora sp. SA101]